MWSITAMKSPPEIVCNKVGKSEHNLIFRLNLVISGPSLGKTMEVLHWL